LKNKIENCLDSNKYNEDFINIVRYLLQTNEYLSTNYTLGDLENSYGISKKQISEIIYQNTGNNFTNLIAKLRINYAKTLIEAKMPYTFDYLSYQVDRKSTRLNSSHVKISYAVFCLKKK